ncbi:hypothetical protein NHQ30_001177 [Ciborinia camelliae]|nr:hypothetical protein NHQ30_001177 [Ciborinia camelliae]
MERSTVLSSDAGHAGDTTGTGERGEEEVVKKYKIHVSSKYVDLTKKKLELTRLPHERPREGEESDGEGEGGELNEEGVVTKREIEGLIDYWLEDYSWRTREGYYNDTYPQYRTTFTIPESNPTTNINVQNESSQTLRIHFLHVRSPRANAVPLLLVPSFPNSNLSLDLGELAKELCEPEVVGEDAQDQRQGHKQAFHVVIPSIPGTGFSDELPGSRGDVIKETARLFGRLMNRLGYEYYIASMMGSGRERGGEIDYYLGREIGNLEECRGVHLIEPRWGVPTVKEGVWDWVRWKVALFFHAGIWGYEKGDWKSLSLEAKKGEQKVSTKMLLGGKKRKKRYGAVATIGLREPDTLAYALCDSPVGLLSFVATALRKKSSKHQLGKEKIIDLCQLFWFPGPEAALRYYANAILESEQSEGGKGNAKGKRVAITVFDGDGDGESAGYSPPAWGMGRHEVVFVQRASGKPGLLGWERLDVIFEGIRSLAKEVIRLDDKIQLRRLEEVVGNGDDNGHGMQLDVESPDTIVAG